VAVIRALEVEPRSSVKPPLKVAEPEVIKRPVEPAPTLEEALAVREPPLTSNSAPAAAATLTEVTLPAEAPGLIARVPLLTAIRAGVGADAGEYPGAKADFVDGVVALDGAGEVAGQTAVADAEVGGAEVEDAGAGNIIEVAFVMAETSRLPLVLMVILELAGMAVLVAGRGCRR